MTKPVYILKTVQNDPYFFTIEVRKQGHGRMEFRGDGYNQWMMASTVGSDYNHIRARGTAICWSEWLHNSLIPQHTCILHTDSEFCIHEKHEDYAVMEMLWDLANMSDREVLHLIR